MKPNNMTNKPGSFTIMLITLICALLALGSCSVQDPMYAANYPKIKDTDFPPNYIVGVWVYASASPTQDPTREEAKCYTEIKPNGRGRVREYSLWRDNGDFISKEADVSWRYLGNNRWEITYPPTTAYTIIESKNVKVPYSDGFSLTVRFYDGKLFSTKNIGRLQFGTVFVRATKENVSELINRARRQPQVIKLKH